MTHAEGGETIYPYDTDMIERLYNKGLWFYIEPRRVRVNDLVPTQDLVSIDRIKQLLGGADPEGGDEHAHVVMHNDTYYVHDGHHRYVISLLKGHPVTLVRVIKEDTPRGGE
jgi:hypothetical protein